MLSHLRGLPRLGLRAAIALEYAAEGVRAIFVVTDPEKLAALAGSTPIW